ncbi:hypothetical protein HMPREF0298_1419, partial [Corynebacterium lipophiloflavum DSM 44291]
MDNPHLLAPELVALDVDAGSRPREVIEHLAKLLDAAGRTSDPAQLIADAMA